MKLINTITYRKKDGRYYIFTSLEEAKKWVLENIKAEFIDTELFRVELIVPDIRTRYFIDSDKDD